MPGAFFTVDGIYRSTSATRGVDDSLALMIPYVAETSEPTGHPPETGGMAEVVGLGLFFPFSGPFTTTLYRFLEHSKA